MNIEAKIEPSALCSACGGQPGMLPSLRLRFAFAIESPITLCPVCQAEFFRAIGEAGREWYERIGVRAADSGAFAKGEPR